MDLLTWSGSAPMGGDLLCHLLKVEDLSELMGALGLGTTLRLLNKPQNIESYAIHRLVREVRREDVPLEGKEDWVKSTCIAIGEWFKKMRNNFSDLSKYEAEIDHLKAWELNASKHAPQYASRLVWLQAYPSFHQGRYLETQTLLDKAFGLYRDLALEDLDLKAHLLNDTGSIRAILGDPHTALNRQKESLDIRLELHGENNEDVATSLSNVGNALGNLGRYEEALSHSQRALAMQQELFGEKHPNVATSLSNVGGVLSDLGWYDEALSFNQRALAMRQELFGERHPNVATSLNNVGNVLGNLGRYEEALSFTQKAVALSEDMYGESHPSTLRSTLNLAILYFNKGDRESAFEVLKPLLRNLPKSHTLRSEAERLNQNILAKPLRKGFRQPPANPRKRKNKGKRK